MKRYDRFAVVTLIGCAATGVTLRSNHYRVHVPAGWEVIESGGDAVLPTLIRVPPPSDRAGVATIDIRLYPWIVEAPIADPTGDAFKRLAGAGALDLASAAADDEGPCPDRIAQFFVFGRPARAIHVKTATGRRVVITAGHAYGSLVAVVGMVASESSLCAEVEAMDSAVKRLVGGMASSGDPSRPAVSPTLIEGPGGRPFELPPADPGPLSP